VYQKNPVGGRPISTSSRPGGVLLTSEQRYLQGCEIPSRALLAWADACLTARSPNETIPTRRACLVVVSVCPPCSRRARRDQSSSKQSLTCSDMISRTWTGPWKRSRANASAALQLKRRRTDLTRPRGVRLDGNDDRLLLGLEEESPPPSRLSSCRSAAFMRPSHGRREKPRYSFSVLPARRVTADILGHSNRSLRYVNG
jgi:hypothetical protein